MARFSDQVCIVTGGASGIGAKTAEMYVEQGGCVLVGDIDAEMGQRIVQQINHTCGADRALFTPLDVTNADLCQAAIELAVSKWGGVHFLLNSAIKMAPGMLKELSLNDWNAMLGVGLTGTFLMTQAAGQWMIENDTPGSIVTMSSTGGRQPYGMSGAYSTVKSAVIMLAQHFAIEWASHQIRVNSVCAGHTETPLTAYLQDPAIKKARGDVTPLGRVAQPEDIANAILFLFSDEADYITATALDVDGGLTKSVMNHMPGRKWK